VYLICLGVVGFGSWFGLVLNAWCLMLYGRDLGGFVVSVFGYLGIGFGLLLVTRLVWFGLILCLFTLCDFVDW